LNDVASASPLLQREALLHALYEAAELEHNLMCTYLYAAVSLRDGEAEALNARRLPGAYFRPAFFEPTFHKHAKVLCGGCQVHVTDREAFEPMRAAVEMLAEFRREAPSEKLWRDPPYEYEHVKPPIDILYGSDRLRTGIDAGEDPASIVKDWRRDEEAFRELRRTFLLY